MRRTAWVAGLLVVAIHVSSGFADAAIESASRSATGCAGSMMLFSLYTQCGDPILPTTGGSAVTHQGVDDAGNFFFADSASGGTSIEARIARSQIRLERRLTMTDPVKSVTITAVWVVHSGSRDVQGFAGVAAAGFVDSYSFSGRDTALPMSSCEDGTEIQVSGQAVGANFDDASPPGTYQFQTSYRCPSGAHIRSGQVFVGFLSTNSEVRTSRATDSGSVSLSGQLQRLTFEIAE